jgi:hypothetical protein
MSAETQKGSGRTRAENLARLRERYVEVAPGQKFEVDDFHPEDGLGVALLYYAIYGEGFAIDSVYDPEELCRRAAGPDLYMVVGRTETGDIVGLYCLFRNPPGKRIMEAGGWAVLPSYRNTTLAMGLAQRIHSQPPSRLGLDVIFGQSVCDHLITQRMGDRFKSVSCALEIEAMPPRPEKNGGGSRISLLDGFIIFKDSPHGIYLPEFYAPLLRNFYAERGLERDLYPDGEPQATSRCSMKRIEAASLVTMNVEIPGCDFPVVLARAEQENKDCHVRQLIVHLQRPGVSLVVREARKARYFLGGILPLWADYDVLLMQNISASPDFSGILVYTEEAKRLKDLIMVDWGSVADRPHQ